MEHYQVTLTTQNVAYELLALVRAAAPAFVDGADQFTLQSDDGNSAAVFLGGSGVTTAAYGFKLPVADASFNRYASVTGLASLKDVYAISGTDGQKIAIAVFR